MRQWARGKPGGYLKKSAAMDPVSFRATVINIAANAFLFALKLWVALLSGSIALLSEAFNSLTDVIASIAIFICVKVSDKEADEGHPFGHRRVEPIAGIIVAIFAGILGFEVIRTSVQRLISYEEVVIGTFALSVPLVTIAVKGLMSFYFGKVGKETRSPAIRATAIDSFCDILVAFAALIGIVGARLGYPYLDSIAGLVISLWIIYTGYKIGMENIDYLVGRAPTAELMEEIKGAALSVEGVKNINTVRAHYVGAFIHVEIHIEVSKELPTYDSHAIVKKVEKAVEALPAIEKAFIHVDPV